MIGSLSRFASEREQLQHPTELYVSSKLQKKQSTSGFKRCAAVVNSFCQHGLVPREVGDIFRIDLGSGRHAYGQVRDELFPSSTRRLQALGGKPCDHQGALAPNGFGVSRCGRPKIASLLWGYSRVVRTELRSCSVAAEQCLLMVEALRSLTGEWKEVAVN